MSFASWAIPEKVKLGRTKADVSYVGILELVCAQTSFSFEFHFMAGGQKKKEKIDVTLWVLQVPEETIDTSALGDGRSDCALMVGRQKIADMVANPAKTITKSIVPTTAVSKTEKKTAAAEAETRKAMLKGATKHLMM
jgi:hypothetical protein